MSVAGMVCAYRRRASARTRRFAPARALVHGVGKGGAQRRRLYPPRATVRAGKLWPLATRPLRPTSGVVVRAGATVHDG